MTPDGELAIDDERRAALVAVNDRFAGAGLRVLAVARGEVSGPSEDALHGLTFVGFIGLADPPAAGVKETIARLREAGLRTVMLTGDQRLTAETVGRELGVLGAGDRSLDGRELDALTGSDRDRVIGRTQAFSRVTPEHKLIIVESLQSRGEIVAMLGDGINDAAALKKADVGVAMGGRGTDVAKEAAAIVLQNDRFETVAAAVEEGRIIFDNIRKFVFYLFSCNVAEVLLLLVAGLAGLPLPLAPLQLLWLNMVTDTFPALALAIEPGDVDVMRRPAAEPAGCDPLAAVPRPRLRLRAVDYAHDARGIPVGPALRTRRRTDNRVHDAGARPNRASWKRAQPRTGAAAAPRAGQPLCHPRRRYRCAVAVVGSGD